MVVRGGGSAAEGPAEGKKLAGDLADGGVRGATAGKSRAAAPNTAGTQATAQSGVQQPIFSWSTIPDLPAAMGQSADRPAKAGPEALAMEMTSRMNRNNLATPPD